MDRWEFVEFDWRVIVANAKRVLLVGWDAADWKIINPLMERGLMPATQRIVENGAMAHLATLSPPLSPMLWTSIATGKRPYKHGILGFTEPTPDRTGVQPITNLSRKTKAIWNILNQNGKRCNVVGWWPSHPAEPIDGVMVSNHYQVIRGPRSEGWPLLSNSIHPERLAEALAELRVHPEDLGPEHVLPFLPHGDEIDQEKDTRFASCIKTICECSSIQSCATELMENEPWDFMAVYFDSIDHFCHLFMRYHPPRRDWVSETDFRLYQNAVSAAYVYHDMMLARLVQLAGDETVVILMSDHGFHPDHLRPMTIPSEPAGPAAEHREFGIFAICGPGIREDVLLHGASLLDVAPTILSLFGLPVGDDMDGRPRLDAFVDPPDIDTIPSWDRVPGRDGQHPAGRKLNANDSREALEQLIALGYIDRPPDDSRKAVALTQRELDYNLARAYMDGGRHGDAAPILASLYRDYPLEFRFGIQLALCCRALEMIDSLAQIVDDLNNRWRIASASARKRLKDIAKIARQRSPGGTTPDDDLSVEDIEGDPVAANAANAKPETAARPDVFSVEEKKVIRELRSIARGNERTLDFLGACVALARADSPRALELLELAAESNSQVPGYHLQMGDTYLKLERGEDAERSYRRALELDPDRAHAHLGLCRVHLLRKELRAAQKAITRAITLKFHFPTAHYYLAGVKRRLRDFVGAIASLEQALRQNPNFAEAHLLLARIYKHRLGDPEEAARHYQMARRIRNELGRQQTERKLPDLPQLDEFAVEQSLPEFPAPVAANPNFRLPLGAAPQPLAEDGGNGTSMHRDVVAVVSGLPRSGTSMMMQMLVAGGLSPLTDGARIADENNPKGYFELEKIKRLPEVNDWLAEARGKVLKIVAPLVPSLPQGEHYRVVFMERELDEILSSQAAMLTRLKREGAKLDTARLKGLLQQQVQRAMRLCAAHGIPLLVVPHRDAIERPGAVAARLSEFFGRDLNQEAMVAAVDRSLHRERRSTGGSTTEVV